MHIKDITFLKALTEISRTAGEEILKIYHDESKFDCVDFKADDSPLTLADKAAHVAIEAKLQEISPEIPILSEEGRNIPYEERKEWSRFWLVDPLDGTKEFIKRNGEFTVNIALVENGQVVMGCVHVPVTNVTYFAAKGEGAYVKVGDEKAVKIEASSYSLTDSGLRLVCSRSHMTPEVEAYVAQFKEPQTVSMGSSLKLVLVAEGKADIYPRLGPTMEWDTAAAHIIVEEAGGQVLEADSGEVMRYNKENLLNPYFLVLGQVKG